MSGLHAKGTIVPIERSQERLVVMLQKYGAHDIVASVVPEEVRLGWTLRGQRSSVSVPMPQLHEFEGRWTWEAESRHEQAVRERWRSIELVVKGRCEAAAIGLCDVSESMPVSAPPPPPPMTALGAGGMVRGRVCMGAVVRALGRARV